MARTNQLSKEKRKSIITLRTEGQFLNVSPKTIKRYDETGSHEDRPRKGRPRVTSAAEDKFIRVTSLRNRKLTAPQIRAQINATQSSSSRHISTSTVQRRLCESGLYGQIAAKKRLLRKSNKQKRLVWAKKHKELKQAPGTMTSKINSNYYSSPPRLFINRLLPTSLIFSTTTLPSTTSNLLPSPPTPTPAPCRTKHRTWGCQGLLPPSGTLSPNLSMTLGAIWLRR